MPYQRVILPNTYVGEPGDLPPELVGLSPESLADLSAALSPEACEELGYTGVGFLWVDPPPPPPVVPEAVKQLQFRRSLRHAGLYAQVMGYVASQDDETQEAFQYASEIRRDSPLLNEGALALFQGDAEAAGAALDGVFVYGATVVE